MFLYFLSSACDVRHDFCIKMMFGSSLHPVVCRMSYLRDLCLLVYSGVQHTLCCVLILSSFCVPYVASFSGLSFLAHLAKGHVSFCYQVSSIVIHR
jgi:hypothetical protein